jgi:hypothetical protein
MDDARGMTSFGDALERWMTARETGVRPLGRRSGYSPGHISDLRSGRKHPSPEAGQDLDDALSAGGQLAALAAGRIASAVRGLDDYQAADEVMDALADLAGYGTEAGANVVPASGPDLAAAVNDALRAVLGVSGHRAGRESVLPPQVAVIGSHIAAMRRLDDRHGGGALSMRYMTGQLRVALDLASAGGYDHDVGRQLLTVITDMAQLGGWVCFDAGYHGAAERYLLLSGYVARAVGEAGRLANAIGMLSYISAFAGHGADAVRIAAAAEYACPPVPALQARISGRKATACAAAGDLDGFRAASEMALDLLGRQPAGQAPSYLYYLEPAQLISEQGQALVMLAERSEAGRRPLVREAVSLLAPISGPGARPNYPRSALLHGVFLARAYLLSGDLDAAVDATRAALARLAEVQSVRGITYLRTLRVEVARHEHARVVSEFLPEFDAALSGA